jgi:hypothetical protein
MSITITNTLPDISLAINTPYTYTIIATGPSLQYEWYKNGIIIPGEITNILNFPSLQISDGASYYVRVFNMTDSVDSNTATLEIQTVPVITTQPQDTTVVATQTATFQVIANGNSLQYEWRFNGVPILGGPNSFSIDINNCQPSNEGAYSVFVYNDAGSVLSNSAFLTVNIEPPQILLEPQSFKQQAGTLGVLLVQTTPFYNQYQWYKNGVPIINGIQNFIQFNPLSLNDAGLYYVRVYNTIGSVNSVVVNVDVYDTPSVSLPLRDYYQVGKNGEIRMCAGFYGGCFYYQWQKDGVDIPGATGLCYTISNADYEQAGVYTICATNPLGTVCTSTTVYVNPVPQTCFPFETPAGGLAGGGNLASGLTDMKIGRAQECFIREVLPSARGNNCCLTEGPQISPYSGGTTSGALIQKQIEQQALCSMSTNIAVAKLKQYIQPCPVIGNNGVDLRFVKYQRRGIPVEPAPPPPGVFIPSNPAIPKATDGYCVQIIGITQSRF